MPPKRKLTQGADEPAPEPTRRLRSRQTTSLTVAVELPAPTKRRRVAKTERPSEDTLVESRDPLSNDKLNIAEATPLPDASNTTDAAAKGEKTRSTTRVTRGRTNQQSNPSAEANDQPTAPATKSKARKTAQVSLTTEPERKGTGASRTQKAASQETKPPPIRKPRGRPRKASAPSPTPASTEDDVEQLNEPTALQEQSNEAVIEEEPTAFLPHFQQYLMLQRRASLHALRRCTSFDKTSVGPTNQTASEQLTNLLIGTVTRSEGNSCLLLGPKGCGKSELLDSCLTRLECKPVVLRLSGLVQTTDRHALREIGVQLLQQTGKSLLLESSEAETAEGAGDPDPVGDDDPTDIPPESLTLPPSSQLHTLIPVLATLKSPVVVILDSFDLFALHPRQSLLYCLLDSVQNCRAGTDSCGIAVIGMSSRIDTIQLLEKRVKSRFSGRTIRMSPPSTYESWIASIKDMLVAPLPAVNPSIDTEWFRYWSREVDLFLGHEKVSESLKETFSLTKDIRVAIRLLTPVLLAINSENPSLSPHSFAGSVDNQRARPPLPYLSDSPYPVLCVLIAIIHSEIAGHAVFTFEMIYDCFNNQVRSSASAPVQNRGVSVGMVRCSRLVLLSAFEDLAERKLIVPIAAPSTTTAKEFTKYRCNIDRGVIRKAVERSGQVNLKKWLGKAQ